MGRTVLKCPLCGAESKPPIAIGDKASYDSMQMTGNITNCPSCKNSIPLDKKTLQWRD